MAVYDDAPWRARYGDLPTALEPGYESALGAWDAAVARAPERPCVHAFDHTMSFGDLDRASDAFAAALRAGGFERRDRLAVFCQNDPQWYIAMLAAWKAGGIAVALNPMFKEKELGYHLADSGAKVLLCLEDLYRGVATRVVADSPVQRLVTTHPGDWCGPRIPEHIAQHNAPKDVPEGADDLRALVEAHDGQRPAKPGLGLDDVALLAYTSGTTGPPKGAIITHGNVLHNAQVYAQWYRLGEEDVVLGVAPLFHVTGLIGHLAVAQQAGIPLVLFHRFDAGEALRLIEQWRVTFTVGSITVYMALMEHPDIGTRDLSSLRAVLSGGAPVSPAVVQRFEETVGVYINNIYGMTETTSPSHCTPLGARSPVDEDSGALSVGVPVTGAEVRVVDLETDEDADVGAPGELWVRGPMVVKGYWEKSEETAAAISDGWMHTGDVAVMDADGWFYIVDRAKDQINVAGYKVWPREVEDVLYEHEAVREAAVVGVPDPYRGETVKAFVSLYEGWGVTPKELIEFCKSRMAAYKYPREIEILDEVPKTPTGKFLRRELRARAQAATA